MYFNIFLLLVSFLMICMGVIFLIIEISTHITEFFKWNMYKGKTEGTVFSVKKSELTASRRLVEEKIGEHDYLPIEETQDRNFAYPPFKLGIGSKRYSPIFQWKAGEREFRGHYPYLQRKDKWKPGDTIEIHYSTKKPWNYVVKDTYVWHSACIYCFVNLGVILSGIVIIRNLIS